MAELSRLLATAIALEARAIDKFSLLSRCEIKL